MVANQRRRLEHQRITRVGQPRAPVTVLACGQWVAFVEGNGSANLGPAGEVTGRGELHTVGCRVDCRLCQVRSDRLGGTGQDTARPAVAGWTRGRDGSRWARGDP